MVEVHLVRSERASAIGARAHPKLAQELDSAVLTNAYSIDFVSAIPLVVADIRRVLARTLHAPTSIERMVDITTDRNRPDRARLTVERCPRAPEQRRPRLR